MKRKIEPEKGSTLVLTISVVAALLVLLAVAVEYSTQISRNTQRMRKTAVAMEIADGHLEALYTNWRNILRTTSVTYGLYTGGVNYDILPTNHFFTTVWNPGPAPTSKVSSGAVPPTIPTPAPSNFPTESNYQLTQYRIQAVDPMVNLDASENALYESAANKNGGNLVALPTDVQAPGAYGPSLGPSFPNVPPNYFPYSYYYLAAADVKVPALNGDVTAKVRRVFEKKFDLPWTYAIFFVDDLEIEPTSSFIVNGPVHTNGSLFITTNNFTIASPTYTTSSYFPTSGRIEYGSDYVNGYHPKDARYPGSNFTAPNFAKSDPALTLSDCPPSQVAPYLPFGWNLSLSAANGSGNDDSYHEIIEPPANYPIPATTSTDALKDVRYYNQASIKVLIDKDNNVRVFRASTSSGEALNASKIVECVASNDPAPCDKIYKLFVAGGYPTGSSTRAITTNLALQDAREGVNVRITEVDVSKITYAVNQNDLGTFNGVIYIGDTTPPRDMSGNRIAIPGTAATTVPDPSTSAANPSPSPFNATTSPQARLGSTNGTSGGTLVTTHERAIRLVNGWAMPTTNVTSSWGTVGGGLTFVSMNPVYIKGNYNTGGTSVATSSPPSNTTVTSSPSVTGYTRQPAAVICDAINVLSGNWTDANSTSTISGGGYNVSSPRAATSTTINAALVSGIVPTSSAGYSGGAEGFIRLQEDWRTQNFVYYGSISQFYTSLQGNAAGSASGSFYKAPAATRWFYDYQTFADAPPPGNMQIAAYLQQQRWYQVY